MLSKHSLPGVVFICAVLAAALLILAPVAQGQALPGTPESRDDAPIPVRKTRGMHIDGRFYDDRERGWYWFEEDPDRFIPEIPEPIEPGPDAATDDPNNPHKPFSVKWLRIELERARIEAIDEPTRENIEYYGYLEKLALDKAERFAEMRVQVGMVNPGLDDTIDNPVTQLARYARRDTQEAEQTKILRELSNEVGIYYFYKSDCPYCGKQNFILQHFQKQYGFSIMAIAIDSRPMPDGSFPDWVPDRGQAQFLGIESTPTLYLVRPPNDVSILSVGVQALPALERRVLQVSMDSGWIDSETFERAMRGLPRRFLVDAIEDMEDIDWTDRDAALDAFRYASRRGVARSTLKDLEEAANSATPLSDEFRSAR